MSAEVCVFRNNDTGKQHIGVKITTCNIFKVFSYLTSLVVSPDNQNVMEIVDYRCYTRSDRGLFDSDRNLPGYDKVRFFASCYNQIHD